MTLRVTDGYSTVAAEKTVTVRKDICKARDGAFCEQSNSIIKDNKIRNTH